MLSKEISSTTFWVFGMTQAEIEPWSPRPLVNTQTIMPIGQLEYNYKPLNNDIYDII